MTEQRTDIESLRQQADDPTEEQIIAEIEVTRTEMSGTIDEIGHRLSPQVIADQAREQIREATVGRVERIVQDAGDTAQQTSNTIVSTIRENKVPAAMAAIGIGWLAMRMRDQASQQARTGNGRRYAARRGGYGYETATGQGRYGVREAYGAAGTYGDETGGDETGGGGGLGERGRQMGEQAQRTAQDVSQQAQRAAEDMSNQAQEAWQDVQWKAQDQAQNLQRQFDRTLDENPLALGALAVGVGAAVALAIPETQQERELMGEQRDKLLSEVESEASRALDEAEQSARETSEKVRQESQEQQ